MRWEFHEKIHCELWFFSGINFGGNKTVARIHPYGGLQGDTIDGRAIKSLGVIAEPGIRVILKTTGSDGWETMPWRCIQVLDGFTTNLKDGRTAVQIPDLDQYAEPNANRVDADFEVGFPEVSAFADGTGWTFGRAGRTALKTNIRAIRIERIDDPDAELVIEKTTTAEDAPEDTVSVRSSTSGVAVRHSSGGSRRSGTRIPKGPAMAPGGGRKGD